MAHNITVLDTVTDLTIPDTVWLEVTLPPATRFYWLQVDGATRLQDVGAAGLTDGGAWSAGGMKVTSSTEARRSLPPSTEPRSLWLAGDGAATTGRILVSTERS